MKQTAVEWLCNEWLYIDQEFDMKLIDKKTYWERLKSVQEQAKEMEKEQMKNACIQHQYENKAFQKLLEKQFEQYYKETFKSE